MNLEPYAGKSQLTNEQRHIIIDPSRDALLSEAGVAIMLDRYVLKDENEVPLETPQQAFARVACAFSDDADHAERLYNYVSKGWAMFATPVLANGGTGRGLPISCFLNYVGDSREGLAEHYGENLWLSTSGGGIGTYWGAIRSVGTSTSKGNKTTGVIPFIKVADSLTVASWQGSTRRGATAVYLPISHPEIVEFIDIRKPTGDVARRSQNVHNAVGITDKFMAAVTEGSKWPLVDPHTNQVTDMVDARDLWMQILTRRLETGEPYIFFEDTANRALPQHLKDKGLYIHSSNLCCEIMLPTAEDRTAVCCLSSVNAEHYDAWKDDPLFIQDMLGMLDNALEVFIQQAPKHMWRAVNSAVNERSVGLGCMGFHSYLQQKGIPFESAIASGQNRRIFEHIKTKSLEANRHFGRVKGEAPDCAGTGLRFSHTNAVAPNASSSILCNNSSPSIEPYSANAFTQKTSSGVFLIKNKSLDKLLKDSYGLEDGEELDKIWSSIITNEGSVQHLGFLTETEKLVFKTAIELDQNWVIDHAANRQPYIDQGQSVNLFLQPDVKRSTLHDLHKAAWLGGLKSLYYLRTKSVSKTETINVEEKELYNEATTVDFDKGQDECLSCQG